MALSISRTSSSSSASVIVTICTSGLPPPDSFSLRVFQALEVARRLAGIHLLAGEIQFRHRGGTRPTDKNLLGASLLRRVDEIGRLHSTGGRGEIAAVDVSLAGGQPRESSSRVVGMSVTVIGRPPSSLACFWLR